MYIVNNHHCKHCILNSNKCYSRSRNIEVYSSLKETFSDWYMCLCSQISKEMDHKSRLLKVVFNILCCLSVNIFFQLSHLHSTEHH